MPFYARTAGWRARQIAADLFVLLWSVGWWFVGQVLAGLIRALAQAAETTAVPPRVLVLALEDLGPDPRKRLEEVRAATGA